MVYIYLLAVCFIFLIITFIWIRYNYSYWQRYEIPYIKSIPFIGNLKDLFLMKYSFGDFFQNLYYRGSSKLLGIYILHKPALLIRDPYIIELILIKKFNYFLNRFEAADPYNDLLGSLTLPLAKYSIWHDSRKAISALFTSGTLKNRMFPIILQVATKLQTYIDLQFQNHTISPIIEVKEMSAKFTTDLTVKLLFSVEEFSLQNNNSKFRTQCRKVLEPSLIKILHFLIIFFLPNHANIFRAKVFPQSYVNFLKNEVDKMMKNTIHLNNECNDLIAVLLQLQSEAKNINHSLIKHPDFILSQVAIFLIAGFETSSSLIAFTLYEMAKQPKLQYNLRCEIKEIFSIINTSQFTHETLSSMTYLDMLVSEALRMYPAAAFINRECTPNGNDVGFSLEPFVNFDIPKGMPAYISILGLHRDSKYWKDPDRFDPDRFCSERKKLIHPMTYIPFGAGPHACVGSRLGILQIKLGLVHIFKSFTVEICEKTTSKIKFDPKSFMLQSKGGIYLKFRKQKLLSNT
ncbi:probable cytochrome P450 6t3 [Teleopsis dalmanni]|uniref:probable cytochrome P450 6t3 n=1 Tax=Teleopsis dalmanni TaxID=139649 RepID=UPI0018CD693D|nr:probable cytochrome P450 6t3 [Teleopsis dalmanni]